MAKVMDKTDRKLLLAVKEAYINTDIAKIVTIENITEIDPMIDDENFDGTQQTTAFFMVRAIKKLLDDGETLSDLRRALLGTVPTKLENILKEIGNSPLVEEELAEAIRKEKDELVIEVLANRFDINFRDYPIDIQTSFLEQVVKKVVGLTDEKGRVKHTELTKKMGFISKKEAKEIAKLLEKYLSDVDTIEEMNTNSKNFDKEITKILSRSRKALYKSATDYEKELMAQEAVIQITDPSKSMTVGFTKAS